VTNGKRTLTVEIIGDAKSLQKALGVAGVSTDAFGTKTEAAEAKASRGYGVINNAAKVAGGAVLGLGAASLNAAGNFETSLNTFQAVSGATGKEMVQVGKVAKQLGADVKLPATSAQDAAVAMTELAKGGLSVKESLKAARGVLQLSAAAQIDNAEAATITARALNAFALKGREAVRVSDLLAATSNSSTAEITDVAQALQQASASAHQLGVPVEDLTTEIGLMANAGIVGSDAGTSLKTMMARLVPQTNKAADAMVKYGLATEKNGELQNKFFDSEGKFIGMRKAIALTTKQLGGLTVQEKQQAIQVLFGSDAQRSANIVLAGGVAQYDKMHKAVTKTGAAQDLADAKTKGFKGSFEAFKSTLETLAISFGQVLLPAATSVMRELSSMFSGLEGHKTFVLALTGVIGGLSIAILTVTTAIKVWTAASAAFAAVQTAVNLALYAMMASPLLLIVSTIVALGAALVLAYKHSETFRNIVDGAFSAVTTAVGVLWTAVDTTFTAIATITTAVWNAVATTLVTVWEAIKTVVGTYFDGYKTVILTVWRTVRDVGERIWNGISTTLGTIWNGIKTVADTVWQNIKTVIVNPVHGAVSTIKGAIGSAEDGTGVVGWLAARWEDIKSAASAAWDAFKTNIVTPVSSAVSHVKAAIGKGKDGLISWLEERASDVKTAADNLAAPFIAAFTKMANAVKDVVDFLADVVDGVKDAIDWISKIKVPSIKIPNLNPFKGGAGNGTTVGPPPSTVQGFDDDAAGFGLSMTSGFRPGDDGWHGQNRARDYSNGWATPQELAFGRYMAANFGSKLLELIHTPLGFGIKNGQAVGLGYWGDAVNRDHIDHVHVAMANGGVVRARVGETGPEDVYLPTGSRVVPNHASRGAGSGDVYLTRNGNVTVGSHKAARIMANRLAYRAQFG
jgi:TP901 family phage tail tape measure protein